MPLSNAAMQDAASAITAKYVYASTHDGDPSTTGANEGTATRQSITWATPTGDGDFDISASIVFDDGGANEDALYVGIWSAATDGTFGGAWATTGDRAFNASGSLTVDSIAQNGSST